MTKVYNIKNISVSKITEDCMKEQAELLVVKNKGCWPVVVSEI